MAFLEVEKLVIPSGQNFDLGAGWTINDSGALLGLQTINLIAANTSDASDNSVLSLAGGGAGSSARGARIDIHGNEHSTEPGNILLKPGTDVANDSLNNRIEFFTGQGGSLTRRWVILGPGDLVPNADNTYNIGTSSLNVSWLYVRQISSGGALDIETTGGDLTFDVNGNGTDWLIESSTGNLVSNNRSLEVAGGIFPVTDGSTNVGEQTKRFNLMFTDSGYYVQSGSNPFARMWTGSTTLAFQMDKSGGADFSFNNPTGTERILLGGSPVHNTFTATHKYEKGASNPQEGDAVKLVNRKLEKCDSDSDPTCVGLMTSDSLTTGIIDPDNADSSIKTVIEDSFGTSFDHSVGGPHTLYHVASLGDAYTESLSGAKVCNDGGAVSAGDLLETCAAKPGFLRKQSDDIIRASTVAQAIEDVTFDGSGEATGVYVYLKK
jgi:hypothetical protein